MVDYDGFVYIWFDRKHRKYCVGSHKGTINDGYITSTGFMKRAYLKRPEDFKRRILQYIRGDSKDILAAEQLWLNLIKEEELQSKDGKSSRYYNMKKNASGVSGPIQSKLMKDFYSSEKGSKRKLELSERWKTDNPSKEPNWVPPNKNKICPNISESIKKAWRDGKYDHIDQSKKMEKMWASGVFDNRKKTQIPLEKRPRGWSQSQLQKERSSLANSKPKSDEHKFKLSEIARKRYEYTETCPECGFEGSGPVMRRWHFSNCRIR
jgi:hypothetical protein